MLRIKPDESEKSGTCNTSMSFGRTDPSGPDEVIIR